MGPWRDDGQACTDDAKKCHGEARATGTCCGAKRKGMKVSKGGCYGEKKKDLRKKKW